MIRSIAPDPRQRCLSWLAHRHAHRHGGGAVHVPLARARRRDFPCGDARAGLSTAAACPYPQDDRALGLAVDIGSSPMVEGILPSSLPGKYGVGVIQRGSPRVRALSTIVTYVVLCVYSTAGFATRQSRRVRALWRSFEWRFHRACGRRGLALASRASRRHTAQIKGESLGGAGKSRDLQSGHHPLKCGEGVACPVRVALFKVSPGSTHRVRDVGETNTRTPFTRAKV